LSKNPTDRFGSTSDMLAALETIPFTEADRRESQRVLRHLARGQGTPRITTGVLPALPDMPTLAVAPGRPRANRFRRPVGYAAALALLALGGWFINRTANARTGVPRATVADTGSTGQTTRAAPAPVQPAPAPVRPVTPATGKLRLLTNPPSAEILVDGRRIGVGSVVDLRVPAGSRRLRVQATGYESWDTTIVVQPGVTHTLGRITLRVPGE
jgi:hypothetical protein